MTVKPIPDGYHSITPYMFAKNVEQEIDFMKRAFGAEVTECLRDGGGAIMHAEARIGDSIVMMSPGKGDFQNLPCSFYLYVKDTDAAYEKALAAGATSLAAPDDQFYGDRNAGVRDPGGHYWWIATHVEDVSPEEMARRAKAYAASKGA